MKKKEKDQDQKGGGNKKIKIKKNKKNGGSTFHRSDTPSAQNTLEHLSPALAGLKINLGGKT